MGSEESANASCLLTVTATEVPVSSTGPEMSPLCGAGPFAVGVRELLGHYMVLEEQFMEDTADMAIRIDEVVSQG